MTRVLQVHPEQPEAHLIKQAAQTLQQGGLVAFPTETVYGLGANALDEAAVLKIFSAKGRPSADPLIIHLSSVEQLPRVCASVPEVVHTLADAFWPGPLTLILPRLSKVPYAVSAGLETVAVRIPAHPVAQALLKAADLPIAAPSANRFGYTSPTSAEHVLQDLNGRIDLIVDGGSSNIGLESTVLDISTQPARILRPGGITRETLEEILGPLVVLDAKRKPEIGLPSPGMLEKHYSPKTELVLFLSAKATSQMLAAITEEKALGRQVGVLAINEEIEIFNPTGAVIYPLGESSDLSAIAKNLYAGLRWLDEQKLNVIFCHTVNESGLGLAIRDRLSRAATRVIH